MKDLGRRVLGGAIVVAAMLLAGGAAARAAAIRFSHAVVVDQQRPGFEPDVKVDANGTIYTSVPFGFSTTQSFVWASHDRGNSAAGATTWTSSSSARRGSGPAIRRRRC